MCKACGAVDDFRWCKDRHCRLVLQVAAKLTELDGLREEEAIEKAKALVAGYIECRPFPDELLALPLPKIGPKVFDIAKARIEPFDPIWPSSCAPVFNPRRDLSPWRGGEYKSFVIDEGHLIQEGVTVRSKPSVKTEVYKSVMSALGLDQTSKEVPCVKIN